MAFGGSNVGLTLGGFTRGQQARTALNLDESRLALAERQVAGQEAAAIREQAQGAYDQLNAALQGIFDNSLSDGETTLRQNERTIKAIVTQMKTLEPALGLPPGITEQTLTSFATPVDAARVEATADVATMTATSDALVASGVEQERADVIAGIAAEPTDFEKKVQALRNNGVPVDGRTLLVMAGGPDPVADARDDARLAISVETLNATLRSQEFQEYDTLLGRVQASTSSNPNFLDSDAGQQALGQLQQLGESLDVPPELTAAAVESPIPSSTDTLKIEQDLRRDFTKESENFDEVQTQFIAMQNLADDDTGASDIALVFAYFKTLDPQSVVREGEFATAARAMGLPDQIITAMQRLDTGEILATDLRQDLVDSAGQFFQQHLIQQQQREQFYTQLALNAGAAPGNVVRSRIRFEQEEEVDTSRFVGMSNQDLANIDTTNMSDAEKAALSAELSRRGFNVVP